MKRALWPFIPSGGRGLYLNLLGLLILLTGLGSSVFIWQSQNFLDEQDRKEGTTDLATAPLAPEDSRRYTHDTELYYGETGLLMDKWARWFEGLTHGKSLAKTIGVLSLAAATGCFWIAKGSKADKNVGAPMWRD